MRIQTLGWLGCLTALLCATVAQGVAIDVGAGGDNGNAGGNGVGVGNGNGPPIRPPGLARVAMLIDNEQIRIDAHPLEGTDLWVIGEEVSPGVFQQVIENAEYRVEITGTMDPDPSIAWGLTVTDFGAPSSFGFVFSTPIFPVGFPNTVDASVVGGLTDRTGNGVSITPTGAKLQIASVGAPDTNMGVDVGDAVSFPASGLGGSIYPYGAYADGPQPGPGPGPWTTLTATVGFTLSGGSDIASLTGFAQIVPEPSTGILAALAGLAGLAVARKRRRG